MGIDDRPADGQALPTEKTDVAFYAVLAKGLAATGTEMNTFTSGFSDLPGVTAQTWYHWGELWLASAMIAIFGVAPLAARYLVVLPLLLLAAGALSGTLVRRINGSVSRPAFVFGFAICLILTPIPLLTGPFFSVWAAGLLYGIAVFGLAAVAVLFALYLLAVMGPLRPSWPLACFAGSAFAFILPAHIVIALLAIVGVGAVWTIRIGRSLLATRRLPTVAPIWRRTALSRRPSRSVRRWSGVRSRVTGSVAADPWRGSPRSTIHGVTPVLIVTLGAGILLAIPLRWLLARRTAPFLADLCLGTLALLVAGAIAWGWKLASFNMFYFFFAGIAVIATPVGGRRVLVVGRALARRAASALGSCRRGGVPPPARARSRDRAHSPAGPVSRSRSRSPSPSSMPSSGCRRARSWHMRARGSRRSPSSTRSSSASTPTRTTGSCRCASRPT